MTIKELEERLNMPRASIRFYESEGLIHPARDRNGYRNYSEEDAVVLEKVKFLRSLDFTLDEIRSFQNGDSDLYQAVRRRLNELETSLADYDETKTILENLRYQEVAFASLDIGSLRKKSLDSKHESVKTQIILKKNEKPSPVRRFFARGFDCCFYTILWELFKFSAFDLNIAYFAEGKSFFSFLAIPLMTLLFEPVFLHFFQTTPGKAILGIRVVDNDQKALSWSKGLIRTFYVMTMGMGMNIPVFGLIVMVICWNKASKGQDLWWDYDAAIQGYSSSKVQPVLYLLSAAGLGAMFFGGILMHFAPEHTGDVTVEEFSENYNTYRLIYAFAAAEDWLPLLIEESVHPSQIMDVLQADDAVIDFNGIEVRQTVLQQGYRKVTDVIKTTDLIEDEWGMQSSSCYYEPNETENWLEIELTITKKQ